ncbi:MAG: alanyl aminopeptidase, partial [Bacteroidota bacterium]
VGDEVFFATLEHYLTENQYSPVEVDELRMAFEEVTGEDMHWFFDQWFHKAGHPHLSLSTEYADGKVSLTVEQTQTTDHNVPAIFQLPVDIDIYTNGSSTPNRQRVWVNQRKQTFTFDSATEPDVVIFDPQHVQLAQYNYTKSAKELAAQFKVAPSLVDRYLVIQRLSNKEESPEKTMTLTAALSDPFHAIREMAVGVIGADATAEQLPMIRNIARQDPHSGPRVAALASLVANQDEEIKEIATLALDARPYPVVAAGLETLNTLDPAAAAEAAGKLESVENDNIRGALAGIYAASGDVAKLPFFEKMMLEIDGYDALNLLEAYRGLLAKADENTMASGVEKMKMLALDQGDSPWRRLAATKALSDWREDLKAAGDTEKVDLFGGIISEIKKAETEPQLQQIYMGYGN